MPVNAPFVELILCVRFRNCFLVALTEYKSVGRQFESGTAYHRYIIYAMFWLTLSVIRSPGIPSDSKSAFAK
jgi:hypothetical protein